MRVPEQLLATVAFHRGEGPSVGRMISMLVSGGVYLPIIVTMMMVVTMMMLKMLVTRIIIINIIIRAILKMGPLTITPEQMARVFARALTMTFSRVLTWFCQGS